MVDFSPRTRELIAVGILRSVGVIESIKAGEIAAVMPKFARTRGALPKGPDQGNRYPPQRHVLFDSCLSTHLSADERLRTKA